MIKANVTYYGNTIGNYGLPNPYYCYFVVAITDPKSGYIASIYSIASGSPLPSSASISIGGSETDVYQKALNALDTLHSSAGLNVKVVNLP